MKNTISYINNKGKLRELDYLRTIACIAVMLVHITATGVLEYTNGSINQLIITFFSRSIKFTTPVFIFLSGMTSFYSYRNKELKYFVFIKKRFPRVLIPYIIWSFIYFLIYVDLGYYPNEIYFFINSLIYGDMMYHLYFVVILVQLLLLGPFLFRAMKRCNKKYLLMLFFVVSAISSHMFDFKYSDRTFVQYLFFFTLGIYASMEYDKFSYYLKKYKLPICFSYIAMVVIYTVVTLQNIKIVSLVWFFFSTISIMFLYNVCLFLSAKTEKVYGFVKIFSKSSYYVYLMHPLILMWVTNALINIGVISATAKMLIYIVVVIPISVITSLLYTAIKEIIKKKTIKKTVDAL